MGCSGSRVGDDNFEREFKLCSKHCGELDQLLNKLNFDPDQLNAKKVTEVLKKKALIAKYETDIDKSVIVLNDHLRTNADVVGVGKADKEARVLAINNRFETLKNRVAEINAAVAAQNQAKK